MTRKLTKALFVVLGLLSIAVAVIARFVPGLPITPFVLLAAFCFNKSSQRLAHWLQNTAFYRKYLAEFVRKKAMTLKQKLFIQILASTMMVISFVLISNIPFRIAISAAFLLHHYIFIFRIKTYKPDDLHNTTANPGMEK